MTSLTGPWHRLDQQIFLAKFTYDSFPPFQVRDGSNSLADAHLFIDHLVVNKLYLDLFLQN